MINPIHDFLKEKFKLADISYKKEYAIYMSEKENSSIIIPDQPIREFLFIPVANGSDA